MSYSVTIAIYEVVDGVETLKDQGYADVSYGSVTFGDLLVGYYQAGVISYVPSGDFDYVNIIYPTGFEHYHWGYTDTITIDQVLGIAYHYDEAPAEIIGATVNFDANGGSVSPSSITEQHEKQGSTDYTVDIDFPVPTKTGYSFAGWLIGSTTYSAGVHPMYATTSFPTYSAVAQWVVPGIKSTYVCVSGTWVKATVKVFYDNAWHDAQAYIT